MIISNIWNKRRQRLFLFTDSIFCPKENTCDIRAQFFLLIADDRICVNYKEIFFVCKWKFYIGIERPAIANTRKRFIYKISIAYTRCYLLKRMRLLSMSWLVKVSDTKKNQCNTVCILPFVWKYTKGYSRNITFGKDSLAKEKGRKGDIYIHT